MTVTDEELAALDEDGRRIAEAVFRAHPAWREHAWTEIEEGESEPHLVVQLPAPSDAGFDLELSTYGGELTLSTRFWHEHASMLSEDEADLGPVLELVDELLGDRVLVWSRFRAGEWDGSGLAHGPEELVELEAGLGPDDWVWIRSHSGAKSRYAGRGPKPEDL